MNTPSSPFLKRVRRASRLRHYSICTEQADISWVRKLVVFHGKRHPEAMAGKEVAPLIDKPRKHLVWRQEQYLQDMRAGNAGVYLPHALARTYPRAPFAWGWQYVFPSTRISIDPRSGHRRRHHT